MIYPFQNTDLHSMDILDFKTGDITGDNIIDYVYLVGQKESPSAVFAEKIGIMTYDGGANQVVPNQIENASGCNVRLFLGNFTVKYKLQILACIDSGSGTILAYLYDLKENKYELLFDHTRFNEKSIFKVIYRDYFKVEVSPVNDIMVFVVDVSCKAKAYINDGIYSENGSLVKPTAGEVLSLGALYPVAYDFSSGLCQLLAVQRITGMDSSDIIGSIQTYLKWDGTTYIPDRMEATIEPGSTQRKREIEPEV